MTWWMNASSVILILGACSACSVSIIYAVCVNMRLSRCKRIQCCCLDCDRTVETAEEMAMEFKHDERRQSNAGQSNVTTTAPPEGVDV